MEILHMDLSYKGRPRRRAAAHRLLSGPVGDGGGALRKMKRPSGTWVSARLSALRSTGLSRFPSRCFPCTTLTDACWIRQSPRSSSGDADHPPTRHWRWDSSTQPHLDSKQETTTSSTSFYTHPDPFSKKAA